MGVFVAINFLIVAFAVFLLVKGLYPEKETGPGARAERAGENCSWKSRTRFERAIRFLPMGF